MFQLPPSPDLNRQLLITRVMIGRLISAVSAYTWRRHKPGRVKLISKKLIPVYIALIVGLFLSSLLTQPDFHEISQTCKDYQLQKTLYSSTPANLGCDHEIADSEATYLAAYPVLANQQSPLGYLGLLGLGGSLVVVLWAGGSAGRTRRDILKPETLRDI